MERTQFVVLVVGVVLVAAGVVAVTDVLERPEPGADAAADEAVPDPVAGQETAEGLLYRVEGGANEAYLFGSIHYGHAAMYPLDDGVEERFDAADALVMEVDMTDPAAVDARMREHGTFDGDRRMTDVVSNATFNAVYGILSEHGHTRDGVLRMKPWYAANLVSEYGMQEAGYDPEQGSEAYFVEQAAEQNMTVTALESVDEQAATFETMDAAAQETYVQGAVANYNAGNPHLDVMARDWLAGEEAAFIEQRQTMRNAAQSSSMAAFNAALLDERDERMATEIGSLLDDGEDRTYFIVVGSLHLVGENSISDNLEDAGYAVTAVPGDG